ncbi:hypothetical protein ABT373_30655 [Streptomyces sp. NPDC000070]|uniref:hypothetical protein n=1 Tax=Streptomyces sp. NPDC000070 TaxID=3154240 RepID=UPI00332B43B9
MEDTSASAGAGLRQRTSGGPLPGMPFNADAAEARAAIVTVLSSWAGLVAETRRVTPPERTIDELAGFLGRHAHWLAAHVAAADATTEFAALVRQAQRVLGTLASHRVKLGPCPEPSCPGTLNSPAWPAALDSAPSVRCSANPAHLWQGDDLLRLGRTRSPSDPHRPSSPTTTWLTAADIAHLWSISPGSVYRLANERNWRRERRGARVSYHGKDVYDTMRTRHSR